MAMEQIASGKSASVCLECYQFLKHDSELLVLYHWHLLMHCSFAVTDTGFFFVIVMVVVKYDCHRSR